MILFLNANIQNNAGFFYIFNNRRTLSSNKYYKLKNKAFFRGIDYNNVCFLTL